MSFLADAEIIISALQQYYQESISGDKPVINQIPLEKIIEDLDLASHIRDGDFSGERLSQFIEAYLDSTTRLNHPAYFGHQEASYLFHEKDQPGVDLIHRTVECTKAGLGLKLFFVLAALGEKGMAEYIDRQFQLTMDAYNYIRNLPDFECAVQPQANILCFRVQGNDDVQLAIRDRLTAQGDFYISTTAFRGKRYLRVVVMSPHTTMKDIRGLIEEIRRLATIVTTAN